MKAKPNICIDANPSRLLMCSTLWGSLANLKQKRTRWTPPLLPPPCTGPQTAWWKATSILTQTSAVTQIRQPQCSGSLSPSAGGGQPDLCGMETFSPRNGQNQLWPCSINAVRRWPLRSSTCLWWWHVASVRPSGSKTEHFQELFALEEADLDDLFPTWANQRECSCLITWPLAHRRVLVGLQVTIDIHSCYSPENLEESPTDTNRTCKLYIANNRTALLGYRMHDVMHHWYPQSHHAITTTLLDLIHACQHNTHDHVRLICKKIRPCERCSSHNNELI